MNKSSVSTLTITSLLIAIGIIIPMVSPIKLVIPPASYTLASHVAIFISMFISWRSSAIVSIGTSIGFMLGGFPPIIVLRAISHIIFAVGGALYLEKVNYNLSAIKFVVFSFVIGVVHAIGEVFVVSFLYFGNTANESYYQQGFLTSVLLLVGLGTLVHSVIDFKLAQLVRPILKKNKYIS